MTALLFVTRSDPGTAADRLPLARSLRKQDRPDWRLIVVGPGDEKRRGRVQGVPTLSRGTILEHTAVAVCDPDTILEREAVGRLADALASRPDAEAVYGDETRTNGADRPILRPAWSPELARSLPYFGDPLMVRTAGLGGLATDLDPGPDGRLRLALHLVERRAPVLHYPVPVSRRPGPVAGAPSRVTLVDAHLRRCGSPAVAVDNPEAGSIELLPAFSEHPLVSVVIPSAGRRITDEPGSARLVERCLRSLEDASWPTLEVLVVTGDEYEGDPRELSSRTSLPVFNVPRSSGPFSFSEAANAGTLAASGRLVLLLNDDTEARPGQWIEAMAMHALEPTVGAVGALLLYADGTIQHAGMIVDDARPLHPFVGRLPTDAAPSSVAGRARTVAAVTGACLMVERSKLLAVGGLSPVFPLSFNDVDLCFKLARTGLRTVIEPAAVLVHHEGASRVDEIDRWEWDRFIHRWGGVVDPWYHPAHLRPGDPADPRGDADHLLPDTVPRDLEPRDDRIRPAVHHSRTGGPPGPQPDGR